MAQQRQINYGINFNVNQSGLNALKASLNEINQLTANKLVQINPNLKLGDAIDQLMQVKQTANTVQEALNQAFNQKLGTLNLTQFNSSLAAANLDLKQIHTQFSSVGVAGQRAFRNLATELLTTNLQLKETHSLLDEMATTMGNTIKWGIASSAMNSFTGAVSKAYSYVVKLDTSLNDIRIVTNKSSEDMERFAVQANKVAQSLGASTRDFTDASLIYYQQGLSDKEAQARAEVTLKAANVTGQTGQDVSEQLTAVWNGYKVTAEEAELYVDKLAAVAASTAADLEELSTGMSKVASAANAMGVDVDQLNAQLATIVSVTRQAPESVGVALKTIYARMGDIEAGLDSETTLGNYTEKMAAYGVNVLDANNKLRDMGEIIEEVGSKWTTMSREQQVALTQVMAGTRQYNNLLALFENWDMYTESIKVSEGAMGTLQKQQDIYMESTEAHLQRMRSSFDNLYDSIFDEDTIKDFSDGITLLINGLANLVDSVGGGGNALLMLGSVASRVFSKNLAQGLATTINNVRALNENSKQLIATYEILDQLSDVNVADASLKQLADMKKGVLDLGNVVTTEQQNEANAIIRTTNELYNQKEAYEERVKQAERFIAQHTEDNIKVNFKDIEDAGIDTTEKERQNQRIQTDDYTKASEALKEIGTRVSINVSAMKQYDKSIEGVAEAQTELNKAEKNGKKSTDDIKKAEEKLGQAYDNLSNTMDNCIDKMQEMAKTKIVSPEQAKELNNAVVEFNQAVKNNYGDVTPEIAEKLLGTFKKVNEEIKRDAQTTSETLKQTVNGGGQEISKNLSQIQTQWNAFIANSKTAQIAKQFIDLAGTIGQVASGMNALVNIFSIWENQDLSVGEKTLQTFMAIGTALPMLISGFMALTPTLYGVMTSLGLVAAAEEGVALSAGAMWSAMLGPVALVVAAIAGVVAIASLLIQNAQKTEREIKNLKQAAEDFKNESEQLKEKVTQLTTSFNEYEGLLGTLSRCTQGTEEWRNALNDVYNASLSILETYPELLKLENLYTSIGGKTVLNTNVLDDYVKKLEKQQKVAQTGYLSTIALVSQKELNIQKKDVSKNRENIAIDFLEDINKVGYLPPDQREVIPQEAIEDAKKAIDHLTNSANRLSEGDRKRLLEESGASNQFVEELEKYQKEVTNLEKSTEEAAIQIMNAAKTIGGAIGDEKEDTIEDALQGQAYMEEFNKQQEYWEKRMTGSGISKASGGNNKIYQEILQELKETEEYKDSTIAKVRNGVQGTDANRELVFRIDGEEVKKSAEEWAAIIAATKANENLDLTEIAKEAENLRNSLSQIFGDQEQGGILANALFSGDFLSLSEEQLQSIKDALNNGSLKKAIEDSEAFKMAGYKNSEEFIQAIENKIDEWSPDKAKKVVNEKTKTIAEGIAKDLDVDADTVELVIARLKEVNKNTDVTEEELNDLAKYIIKVQKGWDSLSKGLEDNKDVLNTWIKSGKSAVDLGLETEEAVGELRAAFRDIFNVDVDEKFLKDNFNTITKAAKGSAEAVNELEIALGKQFILDLDVNYEANLDSLYNDFQSVFNQLANTDIEVGATFNDADALAKIQSFFMQAKLSQSDAQAVLNKFGYKGKLVEVKGEPRKITKYTPITEIVGEKSYTTSPTTFNTLNRDGTGYQPLTIPGNTFTTPVYATRMEKTEIEEPGQSYWVLQGEGQDSGVAIESSGIQTSGSQLTGSVISTGRGAANRTAAKTNTGGKSSGSSSKPKKIEKMDDEADRYHQINTQIEKVDKSLSKLQSQEEKLFGSKLIDNLNQQWELLNNQVNNYNEKLKIAQGEQAELRNELAKQGVQFNADGTIANYMAVFQAQENYVNGLIDQYNRLSVKQQETWDEAGTIDKAKENFSKFQENMDRYDELVSDFIPGLQQNIQDAIDEQIDLQIQKFDMEIEIRLDLSEAERDWNEFKKKIIDGIEEDDILGNTRARLVDYSSYYKNDNTGVIQALQKQVDNTLAQLYQMDKTGWSDVYGDNRATALEDLDKYYKELSSNLMDVLDLQNEIRQSYIDMMDEAQEKFDEQITAYEMISDLIEHDMNLISMVYGEESYGRLAKYYDKQEDNFNKQLDFQRQQVDFWYEQMNTLEEGSEAWDNAKEKWMNAVSEWNDLVEQSIENLQDKYLNAINLIFQNLNNKVTDGLGLDYVEEEWNLINQNADQYLDTINSLYETQKLESKYLDAIDNTDNVAAQRQLKEIMDAELADLRERDKLTEYDIERANKKYEIALKQIALQEAQQNKSKMRLRRDSQGNYRYEYTADQDQIGQLQDELGDMYNSLYNFDKSKYQDNLNQIYDVWVEFQEKMAEAAQINDPIARAEKEALLQSQYEQLLNGLVEQNTTVRNNLHESAFEDLSRLYDVDISNFQNMTDEEKDALMGDLLPYWESGVQHMTDVFAGEGGFLGVCKDAFGQLYDATKEYEDSLDELEETGRLDFESIGEGADEVIEQTQSLLNENNELINSYEQQLTAINNVIAEMDGLIDKYKQAEQAAIAATKAAYSYWSEQQRQAAAAAGKEATGSGAGNPSNNNNNSSSSASGTGRSGNGSGDGVLSNGDTATYSGRYYYDSYGSGPSGSKYSGVANGIVIDRITNNPYGIHIHSADGRYRDLGWIKKSQLSGYDTGGYTGEWGNTNGRLALLHQKELVLNSTDTKNILNAVNIMRTISGAMLDKLSAATANSNTGVLDGVLEQNVHIDALFPNVTNSTEIENALNNLVNMASMRANKR